MAVIPLSELQARLALPSVWRILGRRMRPFTLGHALAIEGLLGDREMGWGELSLCAIIASRPPAALPALLARLARGAEPLAIRLWGWQVRLALWWLRLRRGPEAIGRQAVTTLRHWREYIEYWTASPPWACIDPDAEAQPAGGSPSAHLLLFLQRECRLTRSQAEATTLLEAQYARCLYLEQQGLGQIVTDDAEASADALYAEAQNPEVHKARLAAANAQAMAREQAAAAALFPIKSGPAKEATQ